MIPVISCQYKVDLGFVLDSSGSLENNYVNEKYFLKTIASSFGISKDGTRAGVITFSYTAKNSIKMNDHYDVASFNAAVDEIPLMGYTTRIDRALRMAQVGLIASIVFLYFLFFLSIFRFIFQQSDIFKVSDSRYFSSFLPIVRYIVNFN